MGLDDLEKAGAEAGTLEGEAKQKADAEVKQSAPKYEQEGKDFAKKEAEDVKSKL